MDCRVRIAQIDTTLGNWMANVESHAEWIRAAIEDGIDLIVFPELSLTGYFLKDQTSEVALTREAPEFQPLLEYSHQISIVVGFVERGRDERVYNSTAFLEDGEIRSVHRKVHLVTYGMFEDARDWAAGKEFATVESKHGRFGLLTCEDAWHIDGAYLYFLDGVDAIVVTSAGPGRGVTGVEPELESNRVWRTIQDAFSFLFRTWIVYANRVGWEDGIVFAGGSRVVDPFGNELEGTLGLDPGALDATLSSDALKRARIQTPLRRDERPWILASALAQRVRLVSGSATMGSGASEAGQ